MKFFNCDTQNKWANISINSFCRSFYPIFTHINLMLTFFEIRFFILYITIQEFQKLFLSLFTIFLPTTECWRFIFQYSARFRPVCNRCVCVCVPFVVKAAGVFWPGSSKPEDKVGELLLRDSCLPHQKGRFFVHKNWKFRWKIVNF